MLRRGRTLICVLLLGLLEHDLSNDVNHRHDWIVDVMLVVMHDGAMASHIPSAKWLSGVGFS